MAGAATLHAQAQSSTKIYPRSQLVRSDDTPVTLDSLNTGESLIFSYPYQTTPCFLVRLSESAPGNGRWSGGLGEDQSIVAFSAICSHKMSHPAKPISHINYRGDAVTFLDKRGIRREQKNIISCCSERSVYDPIKGGQVLGGPAPVPLAAIALEADENACLFAVGSLGIDQYDRFLTKFGFRLAMEYGVTDIRAWAGDQTVAVASQSFSQQQIRC
jgi:Rieske Fe-S protein